MTEPSDDFRSRVEEYKQGLENLLVDAQVAIDRQAPELIEKVAAAARNLAQRLDGIATEARRRADEREAAPGPGGPEPTSESESHVPTEPLEPEEALAEDAATEGEEPSRAAPDEPPASPGEPSTSA
jgi:hypothetical protein